MLDFINEYVKEIDFNKVGEDYEIVLPFKFFNAETVITLHLHQTKNGYYLVDDKGYTMQYLAFNDVNISEYKDKIETICNLFSLKIENGVMCVIIGYGEGQTYKQLHSYLQGISHLSTLKILD